MTWRHAAVAACALTLWLVATSAHAQTPPSSFDVARDRFEHREFEAAIPPLEDAEEEETGQTRVQVRLMLGRAYGAIGERDEQRFYLNQVVDDPDATPQQIERAEWFLEGIAPSSQTETGYNNVLSNDPLLLAATVFGGLEALLLLAGGIVMAETECVNDPVPCSSTGRHVGLGLLIAGSVWWIVPGVLAAIFGLGVGAAHTVPTRTGLREPGVIRF